MKIEEDEKMVRWAIKMATAGAAKKVGGPFGAVIVKAGEVLSAESNRVYANNDPTAHGEIQAIRAACQKIGSRHLEGATLYTSCEPCPMCFSAAHYAKIDRIVYAASHADADEIAGFGVDKLYRELAKPLAEREIQHQQLLRKEGLEPFNDWVSSKK
ncbi:MAG: nucleoside deaminase [Bacteroidota bacterium]